MAPRKKQGLRKPTRQQSRAGSSPHGASLYSTHALYIEGRRAAAEALAVGFPVTRALVARQQDGGAAEHITLLQQAGVPIEYVSRAQLDILSSHGAHQGIVLEIGEFPYVALEEIIERAGEGSALIVVLDHVTDEGNLGAIIRSAEAVGAAGVVIPTKRAAYVGVGTFKTSAGAALHLPIARQVNLARTLMQLKEAGFWIVGASERAQDNCWSAPMGGRVALVMGSEHHGISRLVQEQCDFLVRLPQRGHIESLNVAQAATVCMYEWLRREVSA